MTASEVLNRSGVCTLPVDLNRIAAAYGIKTVSYESCAECYDMELERMYREISPLGFSFRADGSYVVAINRNSCGGERRRWTLAHEIAHVLLGHVSDSTCSSERCEKAADEFASQLLAPLSVLHFCCVSSAEEICRICGVSMQAAEIRFRQLTALRKKNSAAVRQGDVTVFAQTMEERELLANFMPFISEYITRRSMHDGYEKYLGRIKGHDMIIE